MIKTDVQDGEKVYIVTRKKAILIVFYLIIILVLVYLAGRGTMYTSLVEQLKGCTCNGLVFA